MKHPPGNSTICEPKELGHVLLLHIWMFSAIELYGMTAINFRTTFATMMVASGVDIKTTQALMGHSTPEMTLKVYAKKEESRLPDAVRKMETFLAGCPDPVGPSQLRGPVSSASLRNQLR